MSTLAIGYALWALGCAAVGLTTRNIIGVIGVAAAVAGTEIIVRNGGWFQ